MWQTIRIAIFAVLWTVALYLKSRGPACRPLFKVLFLNIISVACFCLSAVADRSHSTSPLIAYEVAGLEPVLLAISLAVVVRMRRPVESSQAIARNNCIAGALSWDAMPNDTAPHDLSLIDGAGVPARGRAGERRRASAEAPSRPLGASHPSRVLPCRVAFRPWRVRPCRVASPRATCHRHRAGRHPCQGAHRPSPGR